MSLSFWHQRRRARALAYDVIVVGGGIVGCSTAYWLERQKPSLDVALVEAHSLGAGASGRNAGFVLQGTAADYLSDVDRYGERTARRLWHFTRVNRDLIESELRGHAFDWRSNGSLTVAGDAAEDDRLRASVGRLRAAGAPVVYLEPEQTNNRIHATGLQGGLFVTTGAVVDPLKLVRHLAAQTSADFYTHLPVENIRWDYEDGVLLDTPDQRLWARRVVLAVGPALPSLVPALSSIVRPVRAQMLATAPADQQVIPVPVYSHRGGFYIRQTDHGHVIVGGGRHQHRRAEETGRDATTPAVQSTIEHYLDTHFPWTQHLSIQHRWSGTMGFSPDGRPVVGPVPGHPDSVFATGFTGHGMGYGFRMGRLLAQRTGGTTRPDGYELFSVSRLNNISDREGTPRRSDPSSEH